MQINATLIREGMVLVIDGDLYRVTWKMHRTPGKGNACMQTKLKNIINGRNLEKRFLSSERVEKASLAARSMQYLYKEPTGFIFMDNESFDQITISTDIIGESAKYLQESEDYQVTFYEENVVGLELPRTMELIVTLAPPEIKKATAAASLRPVECENGITVNAPSFIKDGDKIRINTETGEYLERVKEYYND
ncbi:elongation factor P [Candidatus Marinamargulisbacteria bacterium SCGC AG-414-C22]|nr:elongation factor P [Candidatus Marinamargulisbacteria bacterium SCGC AG-414-C22]